jgi:hypothetical protein
MSTKQEGTQVQTKWANVTTPLHYLALTHKQLLVFYGSVITVGTVTQRPFLAGIALVLAGLPQLSLLLLSVVDREALAALGEDASQRNSAAEGGNQAGGGETLASQPLPPGSKEFRSDSLLPHSAAEHDVNQPNV